MPKGIFTKQNKSRRSLLRVSGFMARKAKGTNIMGGRRIKGRKRLTPTTA